jgi:hypothetical protein
VSFVNWCWWWITLPMRLEWLAWALLALLALYLAGKLLRR